MNNSQFLEKFKKNRSRTDNSLFNFLSGVFGQFLTIVLQFVVRTVFIHTLGKSYLGINGLFSNLLSMLSLAEFGVGSAILYKLYSPIASNDTGRITTLIHFYKSAYRVIGLAVMCLGLLLIPFLPVLIKDYDKLAGLNINAAIIFCLYLSRTVSSYLFFSYKSAIINANQKEYLLNIISYFFTIGLAVVQIISLLLFSNFELYILLSTLEVILRNLYSARLAEKMYPYINDKPEKTLSKREIKDIFKDCAALFLYKINGVVLKATDNIVLSFFMGLEMVGMYSNYYVLYTAIDTVFIKVYNAVTHSLGNLHTYKQRDHEYEIFRVVNLVTAILGGTAGIGVAVCADELLTIWIGKEWVLAQPFSILMGIEIYTLAMRQALSKYRTTMGLFQQAKYRPIAGMLINLVVSVLLVKRMGINGVLLGTIIADWTTIMWYDPIIIHKYGFENQFGAGGYFARVIKYTVSFALLGMLDLYLCRIVITPSPLITLLLHILICGVTVPAGLIALSLGTYEGKYLCKTAKKYCKKILRR
ncbi:MAG: oligosaccharide flippase family protein [Oscillospiraceae bacterium]|nr:oligosaccharide flippase family protein [Oscillospiraceae bacterium]